MAQFHTIFPEALFSSDQVLQAELDMVKSGNTRLYDLVEKAGKAAANCLLSHIASKHSLILVGSGNNGSDALVVARILLQQGIKCTVLRITKASYTSEYQQALNAFTSVGGTINELNTQSLELALSQCDCVVDGLLGIGLTGNMRPSLIELISKLNQSPHFVLSLDVPSGINADTGNVPDLTEQYAAVKASVTICFGALKQGLFTSTARDACGEVEFADIGLQEFLPENTVYRLDGDYLTKIFHPRGRNTHKGSFGKVCVIGGDIGMAGAARLAAEACQRVGAGLVTVISHPAHQSIINTGRPELMFHGCSSVDPQTYQRLARASVLVLGPGLGTRNWGSKLFNAIHLSDKPLVLDADGLNLLAKTPNYSDKRVITPHPGEAARLLGVDVVKIETNRFAAVKALQEIYGGVVVLKGAGSLIFDGKQTVVAPVGNPGLASGGCGDVLSGIIGGLIAQGMDLMTAAVAGVIVHGDAASMAAADGERGMLASDLLPFVRYLVNPHKT